jgi:hypothetical protein
VGYKHYIWHPVHVKDLTEEQQKLIIPQMTDATFDKVNVIVLARGDKQVYTGESEGLVARIKSLLMLLAVVIHENLKIFKIDVGSTFMQMPITDDVKHKWIKFDKQVANVLLELQPEVYEDNVQPDRSIVVEMDKLSYGFVEAAHYWYENLATLTDNEYKTSSKEKCVLLNIAKKKCPIAVLG